MDAPAGACVLAGDPRGVIFPLSTRLDIDGIEGPETYVVGLFDYELSAALTSPWTPREPAAEVGRGVVSEGRPHLVS